MDNGVFITAEEYDEITARAGGYYVKGFDTYPSRPREMNFTAWEKSFWEKIKKIPAMTSYPELDTDNKILVEALNECLLRIKKLENRIEELEHINNKK